MDLLTQSKVLQGILVSSKSEICQSPDPHRYYLDTNHGLRLVQRIKNAMPNCKVLQRSQINSVWCGSFNPPMSSEETNVALMVPLYRGGYKRSAKQSDMPTGAQLESEWVKTGLPCHTLLHRTVFPPEPQQLCGGEVR